MNVFIWEEQLQHIKKVLEVMAPTPLTKEATIDQRFKFIEDTLDYKYKTDPGYIRDLEEIQSRNSPTKGKQKKQNLF